MRIFPHALRVWSKRFAYAAPKTTYAVMRFVVPADIATPSTARAHRNLIVTANRPNLMTK
jgi:hypothetical protein